VLSEDTAHVSGDVGGESYFMMV